jgi:hypothetical protein
VPLLSIVVVVYGDDLLWRIEENGLGDLCD